MDQLKLVDDRRRLRQNWSTTVVMLSTRSAKVLTGVNIVFGEFGNNSC